MNGGTRRSLAIFGMTSVAAFWVNAGGHVWLLWRGHPLVREHKATLHYRSALLGDAVLLPLVNVLLDRQLEVWSNGEPAGTPRRGQLAQAALIGAGLTAVCHGYQAARCYTNWTMPLPWRWTALGYYHALYMAGQFGVLAYFCGIAGARRRDAGATALLTRHLLATSILLTAFAALLLKDYEQMHMHGYRP